MVDAAQLCGMSKRDAERCGKPCIGAWYAGPGIGSNRLEPGARCAVCGRPATNAHHCPPRSKGAFTLRTPKGAWELKPSLIAVCGSGTAGCHNGFHGGARLEAVWVWESPADEAAWWDGSLLAEFGAHSPELYRFGHWEITDRATGRVRVISG